MLALSNSAKHYSRGTEISSPPVAEVISALAAALDLAEGRTSGHCLRTCVLGMELAREIQFPSGLESDLYYALLLKDAGVGHEPAVVVKSPENHSAARGERAALVARKIGLSRICQSAMRALDERWNGRGFPNGLSGEEIPLISRIARLAHALAGVYAESGPAAAVEMATSGRAIAFDPILVQAMQSLATRGALWSGMSKLKARVLELEPELQPLKRNSATLDAICQAFGEVADAKTPIIYRHSEGVAGVAVFIARSLGLRESEITFLQRAALLHDIGKLAIPSAILDKPGKLGSEEWAVLKTHAWHTYAILKQAPGFHEVSEIAGSHHEKLDGSGYFRGLKGEQISLPARILAIADIYDALRAKRPYRDAIAPELALQIMKQQTPHALDETCFEALTRSYDPAASFSAGLAQLSVNVRT
ncbi:MAG TPA: HD domain-containing phosphohydrolase [Bryobacteraceae bacterium]|nr:HD domain-containing phosphohydrolase [Bryobacteraceae bacterium]